MLHTFDFHEKRVEVAQKEFEDHGVSHLVKVQQKDVSADGFGITEEADAVFLDLPNPWDVIEHAAKALKPRGNNFSNNLEFHFHFLKKVKFIICLLLRFYDMKLAFNLLYYIQF